MDTLKEKWIAIGPSVFVDKEVTGKSAFGNTYKYRPAVAFNVGDDVAKHIVANHEAMKQIRALISES
jgi:hypothetical protein